MKLIVSDTFRASYQKLAADRKRAVDRTIRKMAGDPVPPSLKIRRFESLDGVWIANVGKGDRILFERPDPDTARLMDVGLHDKTYRKWNRLK